MANSDIIKDAILQAKEIKRMSVEQAREQLLETITPKIQSMFNSTLTEEADTEFEENLNEIEQEELEEDFDISGFIQEDEEPEVEAPAEPAGEESFGDESAPSDDLGTVDVAPEQPAAGVDANLSGDTAISDLTVDEFTALFKDLISGGSDDMTPDFDSDASGDSDLDSIEPDDAPEDDAEPAGEEEDEDLNLGEILSEVERTLSSNKTVNRLKKELRESREALQKVTKTLVETNLLNSKLIYVNTLFKKLSLSESQKATVLKNIDAATTPKEAKLVFEALDKSFASKSTKKPVKEALGFASNPAGTAPQKVVTTIDNSTMQRLQYLAGIKPNN